MKTIHKNIVSSSIFFTLIGVGYYAWQQEWVILNYPCHTTYKNRSDQLTNKRVIIWYAYEDQLHKEATDVIWSSIRPTENAHRLVQRTLSLLQENHVIKKSSVSMALAHYTGQELLLFFDHAPLTNAMSVKTKLMIIQSILKTLHENNIPFKMIRFFVGNEPMSDMHLDFQQSWPITGFDTTKT